MVIKRSGFIFKVLRVCPLSWDFFRFYHCRVGDNTTDYVNVVFEKCSYDMKDLE
jgi:hypothetical protein